MNIRDLESIVRTERSADRYLARFCRQQGGIRCPECGDIKLYRIEKGRRLRCSRCKYSFRTLAGRWFNKVKIDLHDWMWILKLFELEKSASAITIETGISYPTVLKAMDTIRMSIAFYELDNVHSPVSVHSMKDITPVDAILFDANAVASSRRLGDEDVFYLSRLGNDFLVLTERGLPYQSLQIEGRIIELVDSGDHFPRKRVYCGSKGFWPCAMEHFTRYHGVSYKKLDLYIKEIEFRWLNRDVPIFEKLVRRLCCFVPDVDEQRGESRVTA